MQDGPNNTDTITPAPSGLWTAGLLVAAAGLRLVSPVPNYAPVGAVGLFGGGRLRSWHAFVLPLVVMLATDAALSFLKGYEPFGWFTLVNGFSYLLYVLLGRFLCRGNSILWIGGASVLGSVQFFLITNFACWSHYAPTLAGLGECYLAGLPFFPATLCSDLFYSAVLFGAYALITRLSTAPKARLAS